MKKALAPARIQFSSKLCMHPNPQLVFSILSVFLFQCVSISTSNRYGFNFMFDSDSAYITANEHHHYCLELLDAKLCAYFVSLNAYKWIAGEQ